MLWLPTELPAARCIGHRCQQPTVLGTAANNPPVQVQTKPHGHGDVHMLLHSSGGRLGQALLFWFMALRTRVRLQVGTRHPLPAVYAAAPCETTPISSSLRAAGLADKWLADGFKWVCFFQDTNGLVFRALPAAIGAHRAPCCCRVAPMCGDRTACGNCTTVMQALTHMNESLPLPLLKASAWPTATMSTRWRCRAGLRRPSEPSPASPTQTAGACVCASVCCLWGQADGGDLACNPHLPARQCGEAPLSGWHTAPTAQQWVLPGCLPRLVLFNTAHLCWLPHCCRHITINVEYNQLDPLLRATIAPEGDVNDDTGFSPFPGQWVGGRISSGWVGALVCVTIAP